MEAQIPHEKKTLRGTTRDMYQTPIRSKSKDELFLLMQHGLSAYIRFCPVKNSSSEMWLVAKLPRAVVLHAAMYITSTNLL